MIFKDAPLLTAREYAQQYFLKVVTLTVNGVITQKEFPKAFKSYFIKANAPSAANAKAYAKAIKNPVPCVANVSFIV